MAIRIGLKYTQQVQVTGEMLASKWGGGGTAVLSTPHLVGLFEGTASRAIAGHLNEGQVTVGTAVNIRHLKPSPEGEAVTVTAEVIEIDRRRVVFRVQTLNEDGAVAGEGTHDRFVVDRQRFTDKSLGKPTA